MKKSPKVDFYTDDVRVTVKDAALASLYRIGLQIKGQAQVNIVANDQVDTGFMLNSGYVATASKDTYGSIQPSGSYTVSPHKHGGRKFIRKAKAAPKRKTPAGAVIVAFAADYAVFMEIRRSFLLRAVNQTVGAKSEAEIKAVAREKKLTK